jgi:adenosine deaminase
LRRKVGRLGLTIEVNPTSNLLIGDLNDLARHPLWRLRPIRPTDDDTPPLPICVGSDDPLVFDLSLRLEYQSLYDAMILAGYSEEEIRRWIDRTRESGLEGRFTVSIQTDSILGWFAHADQRPAPPI